MVFPWFQIADKMEVILYMKRFFASRSAVLLCVPALLLTGCISPASSDVSSVPAGVQESGTSDVKSSAGENSTDQLVQADEAADLFKDEDLDASWDENSSVRIDFSGDSAEITGKGGTAAFRDGILTISKEGCYVLSGNLNGSIVVEADKKELVHLVLDGVSVVCESSAPINIRQADKVVITLADNTENTLTDGSDYQYDDLDAEEPSAVLFSKDDLSLNGGGSLTIQANHNNGIQSKDDLRISGGSYNITAAKNGIVGKDSLVISGGSFAVSAQNDGMKSTNSTDEGRGYVYLSGGTYHITSESDGFQAETDMIITGGEFEVVTAGGNGNSSSSGKGMWGTSSSQADEVSAKGIKAGKSVNISGGAYALDTSDDSIHSNGSIEISGGTFRLSSGDDGVHADELLIIQEGEMEITQSYEGLEALNIYLNGGTVKITASDDGINAAGGNDGSSMGGRPGQNTFGGGQGTMTITGGYYLVDAGGDGLDANGSIEMSGGTVIVNGPEDNGNGALDYDGTFLISGGNLIAAGSSGMAQVTSDESSQNAVMYYLDEMESGTTVRLERSDGEEICTFTPTKRYSSILISSPEMLPGEYLLRTGGTVSGAYTDQNGLSVGGSYSGETASVSFTLSETVTYLDSNGVTQVRGGFGGFGGGRGGRMNGADNPPELPEGGFKGKDRGNRKMPEGIEPPEGMEPPEGFQLDQIPNQS